MTFRDPTEAFNEAIETNQLSANEKDKNFAGNFMYMHSNADLTIDYFKHVNTREYKKVKILKQQEV